MVPKYTVKATIDNLTKDELNEWRGDLTITDSYLSPPETLEELREMLDPNYIERFQHHQQKAKEKSPRKEKKKPKKKLK